MTLTSRVIGTPAFMSPEQVNDEEVGPPSDVSAWGSTIVYAATGAAPFDGGTVPAILNRIVNHGPDLAALRGPLRRAVAAALRKDPRERPTAREILDIMIGGGRGGGGREDGPAGGASGGGPDSRGGARVVDPAGGGAGSDGEHGTTPLRRRSPGGAETARLTVGPASAAPTHEPVAGAASASAMAPVSAPRWTPSSPGAGPPASWGGSDALRIAGERVLARDRDPVREPDPGRCGGRGRSSGTRSSSPGARAASGSPCSAGSPWPRSFSGRSSADGWPSRSAGASSSCCACRRCCSPCFSRWSGSSSTTSAGRRVGPPTWGVPSGATPGPTSMVREVVPEIRPPPRTPGARILRYLRDLRGADRRRR